MFLNQLQANGRRDIRKSILMKQQLSKGARGMKTMMNCLAVAIFTISAQSNVLSEKHTPGLNDSLMVPVAGGTFTAATTLTTISSFNVDKYEVAYELWTAVRNWALTNGYTDLAAGRMVSFLLERTTL
jgi:hypothetical protein